MQSIDWTEMDTKQSIDDMVDFFHSKMDEIDAKYRKKVRKKIRIDKPPWFTKECELLAKERQYIYKRHGCGDVYKKHRKK